MSDGEPAGAVTIGGAVRAVNFGNHAGDVSQNLAHSVHPLGPAERAVSAWQAHPAGRQVLADHPELAGPSSELPALVARTIRDWQSDVLELVGKEGASKRTTARIAAYSVNGVGAALMLLIFFNTGGITGAEGGVAAGTVVLAQRLLESVFGDEAVRRLAETAKQDLDARVEGLMASELARFTAVLDRLPIDAQRAEEIRQAAAEVSRDRQIDAAGQVVAAQADLPELTSGATTAIASGAARVELTTVSPSPTAEVVEAELVPDEGAGR